MAVEVKKVRGRTSFRKPVRNLYEVWIDGEHVATYLTLRAAREAVAEMGA